ncbi:Myosin-9 [Folsomia candida]|uniref:Myosin-9 n=1 Tax=Folsomia candida TaxID=158441 RepID=A0A226DXJ2_FOLCA|nr:Myosin-9 [Folsomia candida]
MESLLQTEVYGQPFSTLCMELCIKDIHESTHDLLKKYHHKSITFSHNTPSWKFPHISIYKLDILPIIEKYRDKSLSECQQYQELLGLLVDRVCFSLLTTCNLLGTMDENNGAKSTENGVGVAGTHLGQGDAPPMSLAQYKNAISNPVEATSNITTTTHPNIGFLLKQLFDTVGTLLYARTLDKQKSRKDKAAVKSNKCCSTSAQTNESSSTSCETCFVALNVLKLLSTMITQCLTTLTKAPSEISKLKKDGESLWNLSHREFLYEWCQAVQTDCKTLLEKASKILEDKSTLQKQYNESKSMLESETRKLTNITTDLNRKLKHFQEVTEAEKSKNANLEMQMQSMSSNSVDLQSQINKKSEECRHLEAKVAQLTESLAKVTQWHQQLHETNSLSEKVKLNLEQEVKALKEQKSKLETDFASTKALVASRDEEIEKLTHSLEKSKREEVKKEEMKGLLEKAKKQLEACKKVEEDYKKAKITDKVRLEKLKEEVTTQQEQIELLTLYPDLNGPINPPSASDADHPLQSMSKQVRSNQLRIEVLQAQTDRLKATLAKCNMGMNSRVQFAE